MAGDVSGHKCAGCLILYIDVYADVCADATFFFLLQALHGIKPSRVKCAQMQRTIEKRKANLACVQHAPTQQQKRLA